ncbi:MAG: undecaprenyl-diphosphate phosphatase [Clostridiaceae bacterium]
MDFIQIFKNIIYAMLIGGTQYLPISFSEKKGALNFLVSGYDEEIIMMIKGIGIIGASLALIFLYIARFNPLKKGKNHFDDKLWKNILLGSCPSIFAIILLKNKEILLFGNKNVNYFIIIISAILFLISERHYKKNRVIGSKILKIERVPFRSVLIVGIIQGILLSLGISPVIGGIIGCWIIGVSTYSAIEYSLMSSLCIYLVNTVMSFLSLNSLLLNAEAVITYLLVSTVSFLMSLLAIDLLMALGKKKSLRVFAFINMFIGIIYLF